MIDRNARLKATALIRQLVAGEVTNDDFERQFPTASSDPALKAIYRRLWQLWDDRSTHTFSGMRALSGEARELCDRCVAFLNSALEYEWPSIAVDAPAALILCRLLHLPERATRIENTINRRLANFGELSVWPFRRRPEYNSALEKQLRKADSGEAGEH